MTRSELRIGCCGFPQPLARYAQTFPVVEVQRTFYQPPLLPTLAKWRAFVPVLYCTQIVSDDTPDEKLPHLSG